MMISAIIPARYKSSRFEGKLLEKTGEKSIIQHVYEAVKCAQSVNEVIVATDDQRIYDVVKNCGGVAVMTRSEHKSGTDRIIETLSKTKSDIIVNVQGDEPFIDPYIVDAVVAPLVKTDTVNIATAAVRISNPEDIANSNNVKVVLDSQRYALYFSRSPIPFVRDVADKEKAHYYKHIGIYCYRRSFLEKLATLPYSMLEDVEKLEQLRFLEAGERIKVIVVDHESIGIDTPSDLEKAREHHKNLDKRSSQTRDNRQQTTD